MRHAHVETGPGFPALRALAFVFRAAAAAALAVGLWRAAAIVREAQGLDNLLSPEQRDALLGAGAWVGGSLLASLLLLAAAELIKLVIHIERNTRQAAAAFAPAPLPEDDVTEEATPAAPARPAAATPRGSRLPWLEGDDPVEGSLIHGH